MNLFYAFNTKIVIFKQLDGNFYFLLYFVMGHAALLDFDGLKNPYSRGKVQTLYERTTISSKSQAEIFLEFPK